MYLSNLYVSLNLHYNIQEELYIQNQSAVNFALGNNVLEKEIPIEENSNIGSNYKVKTHGLFSVLVCNTFREADTVTSTYFTGSFSRNNTAMYLANFGQNISYSGNVSIVGDCLLPRVYIETSYIKNEISSIKIDGKKSLSKTALPQVSEKLTSVVKELMFSENSTYIRGDIRDTLSYNSFVKPTVEVKVNSVLGGKTIKGNFVLRNKDSIFVRKNAVLEDVILVAPKVIFEEGFEGNVQVIADEKIEVGPKVKLGYPSVLCLYSGNANQNSIEIKKEATLLGSIVLFGNPMEKIASNSISLEKGSFVLGDIYCTGKLDLQGTVYGSVYTNRIFYKTESAVYDNLMGDLKIDVSKRPEYFIGVPLFDDEKVRYGIIKKVK